GPEGDWRVRIVGSLAQLPDEVAARLQKASDRTHERDGMNVNVAVGYGGRQEIVDAVQSLLRETLATGDSPEEMIGAVTVDAIDRNLYTKGQPDPDLVIRTSGEQRLSGFLLWQSAYSEIWFTDAYWPEFRRVDYLRALRDYSARSRRFGK
ncbi:di-trans,poly-cis-decaprenylcistransferase, partial [Streptomyces sp. SID10244]|nr:di-trans,poly-cis-decaprenylcistransferase [Streptomyces sp. SID10244]